MPLDDPDAEILPLSEHLQLLIEQEAEPVPGADELPRMTFRRLCRFHLPTWNGNYVGRSGPPVICGRAIGAFKYTPLQGPPTKTRTKPSHLW